MDRALTKRLVRFFAWSANSGSSEYVLHVSIGWSYNQGDP